jgi:hypothetical protein
MISRARATGSKIFPGSGMLGRSFLAGCFDATLLNAEIVLAITE